ncbi:MAG: lipopolysaccharide biosynthesis protein [Planctomycetota bacterium]
MDSTATGRAGESPAAEFRAGVFWSTFGNGVHLLATVAFMPVLTRLYGLKAFANYEVYFAVLSFAAISACLCFDFAVPVQRSRLRAVGLALVGLGAATAVCVLLAAGVAATHAFGFASSRFTGLAWCVVAGSWMAAANRVLYYLGLHQRRFGLLASGRMAQAVVTIGVQITAAFTGWGVIGLVIGDLAGRLVALLLLQRALINETACLRRLSLARVVGLAWRNRRLPLLNGLWILMQTSAIRLPVIVVAGWWGPAAAGSFAVCQRALDAPRVILTAAMGHAWFAVSARLAREVPGELNIDFRRHLRRLFWLVLPAIPVCMIWGEDVFAFVFGERWRMAGTMARWVVPWFALRAIVVPLRQSLLVVHRQSVLIVCEALVVIGLMAIAGGCALAGVGVIAMLAIYAIWCSLVLILQAGWHERALRRFAADAVAVESERRP